MADARAVVAPLVQDLTAAIRDALGANLLALYLWGSYAVGDFDPQLSDVDLVAVVHRDVTGDEYAALDALHRQIAARYPVWAGRVEVAYATRATLDHPETGGEIVRISPGEPLNRRRSDSRWTVDWYVVRTRGIPLHGPPPTVLLAPITPAQFVESVRANVDTVGEWVETVRGRRGDAYAILLMCRALRATLHGDQLSKPAAGRWAQAELPEWSDLIGRAIDWRGAPESAPGKPPDPETLRFVEDMRRRILGAAWRPLRLRDTPPPHPK